MPTRSWQIPTTTKTNSQFPTIVDFFLTESDRGGHDIEGGDILYAE
jgi:hypothetical protein